MKTIRDINNEDRIINLKEVANKDFLYQELLTPKLDELNVDFNQEIINEIVLWKVNRYAQIKPSTFDLLNQISKKDTEINAELTKQILLELLDKNTKGVRLAMASTILRFKNPNIYQILDQRVFRQLYKKTYKPHGKVEVKINLYLEYLKDLRNLCQDYNIEFSESDRVLYQYDKIYNPEKINY